MKSEKYIIDKIKEIHSEIDGIKLTYAYDKVSNFHIVEVSPENIRRGSDQYIKMESDFWCDFFERFPNENLLISEEDEDNDMSNIIFTSDSIHKVSWNITTRYHQEYSFRNFNATPIGNTQVYSNNISKIAMLVA